MYIEITGRIVQKLDEKFGTTKSGKDWQKITYLLQLNEGSQYEHCITFAMTSFDGDVQNPPQPKDLVKLGLQIVAHHFNGKWFNEIQATKCEKVM